MPPVPLGASRKLVSVAVVTLAVVGSPRIAAKRLSRNATNSDVVNGESGSMAVSAMAENVGIVMVFLYEIKYGSVPSLMVGFGRLLEMKAYLPFCAVLAAVKFGIELA